VIGRHRVFSFIVIAVAALAAGAASAAPQDSAPMRFAGESVRVVPFAQGLENPWGMAFLPDGRVLVTERPGRLRIVDGEGRASEPVAGVPKVFAVSQGGLLDVALDPDFAANRFIYLSYAEPRTGGAATAVARAKLDVQALRLDDLKVIFRQEPVHATGQHFGSRLVFARDGTLFVTLGDRYSLSERAQDLSTTIGKVVRINPDGSIPADNPFRGKAGARPEIFSYGHRNVQGAALEPATGALWTIEHGARGGDEVNRPEPGRNYGWPVISYGRHYSGGRIGEGTEKAGMEQPLFYWDPSIAPSGAAFYTADLMPAFKGHLFTGGLAAQTLVMVKIADGKVAGEERLDIGARVRDVRQGPDGALWLALDAEDGAIVRVVPAR
jgi:glucose/arabinose dehydrogenase